MSDILERLKNKAKDHGFSVACCVVDGSEDNDHIMIINKLTKKKITYTVKKSKVKDVEEYTNSIINHAVNCLK